MDMDRIVECKGDLLKRKFRVRWSNYPPEEDTWEPWSHIHPEAIKEYELAAGVYDHDWPHRCDVCGKPCKNERGVKIHKARAHKEAGL